MGKKLKIWLPDDWANVENPGGPPTMSWQDPAATGAFQLSTAEYTGGQEPHPSATDLLEHAVGFGKQYNWGELTSSLSGKCLMGVFGTAAFRRTTTMLANAPEYCQVWFLSNGLDIVFATFISMQKPHEHEVAMAQKIAVGIDFR